ncbi:MAG: hypothetical protein NXH97_20015 [Rhodobacteraceae bacterium]|nr:hypothetical protein [Paracoccaceae bacterium]
MLRGRLEDTGNGDLATPVMAPLENNVPERARCSLFQIGTCDVTDPILASRSMVRSFGQTEIRNEILPDKSIAFAGDPKFP